MAAEDKLMTEKQTAELIGKALENLDIQVDLGDISAGGGGFTELASGDLNDLDDGIYKFTSNNFDDYKNNYQIATANDSMNTPIGIASNYSIAIVISSEPQQGFHVTLQYYLFADPIDIKNRYAVHYVVSSSYGKQGEWIFNDDGLKIYSNLSSYASMPGVKYLNNTDFLQNIVDGVAGVYYFFPFYLSSDVTCNFTNMAYETLGANISQLDLLVFNVNKTSSQQMGLTYVTSIDDMVFYTDMATRKPEYILKGGSVYFAAAAKSTTNNRTFEIVLCAEKYIEPSGGSSKKQLYTNTDLNLNPVEGAIYLNKYDMLDNIANGVDGYYIYDPNEVVPNTESKSFLFTNTQGKPLSIVGWGYDQTITFDVTSTTTKETIIYMTPGSTMCFGTSAPQVPVSLDTTYATPHPNYDQILREGSVTKCNIIKISSDLYYIMIHPENFALTSNEVGVIFQEFFTI